MLEKLLRTLSVAPMTGPELRHYAKALFPQGGQSGLARQTGLSVRTIQKYVKGDLKIPILLALVVRLLASMTNSEKFKE